MWPLRISTKRSWGLFILEPVETKSEFVLKILAEKPTCLTLITCMVDCERVFPHLLFSAWHQQRFHLIKNGKNQRQVQFQTINRIFLCNNAHFRIKVGLLYVLRSRCECCKAALESIIGAYPKETQLSIAYQNKVFRFFHTAHNHSDGASSFWSFFSTHWSIFSVGACS